MEPDVLDEQGNEQATENLADPRVPEDDLRVAQSIAWLGIAGAARAHRIRQHIFSLGADILTLREQVTDASAREILDRMDESLRSIREVLQAPLSDEVTTPVDVNAIIRSSVARQSRHHQNLEVDLVLGDLPLLKANRDWLAMVFENLIDNAFQAMPRSGKLTVSSQVRGDHVEVVVSDTGRDIPEGIRPQLFKQPINHARSENMGVGLLLTKFILAGYGGSVELLRTGPTGTSFAVQLPLQPAGGAT